jgi:hypothetical protein
VIARLLAPGRVEIVRAEAVPGIALGRRTVTVLGDPVIELLVDSRLELPLQPTASYRLARALCTATLEIGNLEQVRHDAVVAAFAAARDPASVLVEKLGRRERPRVRELLEKIDTEAVERWYLDRRLGLARLLAVLAPDVGSAAKELGADPVTLEKLCIFLGSATFESLRKRVRDAQ